MIFSCLFVSLYSSKLFGLLSVRVGQIEKKISQSKTLERVVLLVFGWTSSLNRPPVDRLCPLSVLMVVNMKNKNKTILSSYSSSFVNLTTAKRRVCCLLKASYFTLLLLLLVFLSKQAPFIGGTTGDEKLKLWKYFSQSKRVFSFSFLKKVKFFYSFIFLVNNTKSKYMNSTASIDATNSGSKSASCCSCMLFPNHIYIIII